MKATTTNTTNTDTTIVQLGDDALNALGIGIVEQLLASILIQQFPSDHLETDLDVHMAIETLVMDIDGRDDEDDAPYGSILDAMYQMGIIEIETVAEAVTAMLSSDIAK